VQPGHLSTLALPVAEFLALQARAPPPPPPSRAPPHLTRAASPAGPPLHVNTALLPAHIVSRRILGPIAHGPAAQTHQLGFRRGLTRARARGQHHTAYQGYAVHSAEAGERPFFAARSSSSSGSLAGASPRAGPPAGEPAAPSHGSAVGASPRAAAPVARQDFTACPPPPARAASGAQNGGAAAGAADAADAGGGGALGAASAREAEDGGAGAGPDDEDIRLIACAPTATLREVRPPLAQAPTGLASPRAPPSQSARRRRPAQRVRPAWISADTAP